MESNSKRNQASTLEARKAQPAQQMQRAQQAHRAQRPARRETLEQNTAFGSASNPEGFVATWKNASHLWRARALVCILMALILAVMQPGGPGLYKAWAADGGLTAGGLNITTQAVTEPTWVAEQGTGVQVLQLPKNGKAHFFPNYTYAFTLPEYYYVEDVDSNDAMFGEPQHDDNKWAIIKTEDATTPDLVPELGLAGKGDLIKRQGVEEYIVDYKKGGDIPEMPFWYMGYKPEVWGEAQSAFLTQSTPGYLATDTSKEKLIYVLSPYGKSKVSSAAGTNIPRDVTGPGGETGTFDEAYNETDGTDRYLYAAWVEANDYKLHAYLPPNQYADSDSYAALVDLYNLKWDSSVDLASAYEDHVKLVGDDGYSNFFADNTDLTWVVRTYDYDANTDSGQPGSATGATLVGNSFLYGNLLNPNGEKNEALDPAFWANVYGGTNGSTVSTDVAITPAVSITYYPNGGTLEENANNSTLIDLVENDSFTDVGDNDIDFRVNASVESSWRTVKATPADVGIVPPENESGEAATFLGWADSPDATEPTYTVGQDLTNGTGRISKSYALYAVWFSGSTHNVTVTPKVANSDEAPWSAVTITGVPEGTKLGDIKFNDHFEYDPAGQYSMNANDLGFHEGVYSARSWTSDSLGLSIDLQSESLADVNAAVGKDVDDLYLNFDVPTYRVTLHAYDMFSGEYDDEGFTVSLNVPYGQTVFDAEFENDDFETLRSWLAGVAVIYEHPSNPGIVTVTVPPEEEDEEPSEIKTPFSGWWTWDEDNNPVQLVSLDSLITEGPLDLYAVFDPQSYVRSYTVTLDANGGYFGADMSQTTATLTAIEVAEDVEEGEDGEMVVTWPDPPTAFLTAPPSIEPERPGYRFRGWYADSQMSEDSLVDFEEFAVGDNETVLYAGWEQVWQEEPDPDKTITLDFNGGRVGLAASETVTANSGDFASGLTPTMNDYRFIGWTGPDGTALDKDSATISDYQAGTYKTSLPYKQVEDGQTYHAVWESIIEVDAKASSDKSSPNVEPSGSVKVGAVSGIVATGIGSTTEAADAMVGKSLSVTFTATPANAKPAANDDAEFKEWTGGVLKASEKTRDKLTVTVGNLDKNDAGTQYKATTFEATFDPVYTVTFDVDGTSADWKDGADSVKTKKVKSGDTIAVSDLPTGSVEPKEGFSGTAQWSSKTDGISVPTSGNDVAITEDVTYEASFAEIPKRKVVWDWNDGKGTKDEVLIQSGESAAPTTVNMAAQSNVNELTATYRFVGWSATQIGKNDAVIEDLGSYNITKSADYDAIDPTNGITYYAVWEPTVEVKAVAGDSTSTPAWTGSGTVKDASMSAGAAATNTIKVGAVTGTVTAVTAADGSSISAGVGSALSAAFTAAADSTPTPGSRFNSWSASGGGSVPTVGAADDNYPITVTPANLAKADKSGSQHQYADTTFTAGFDKVYTITFTLGDGAKWKGSEPAKLTLAHGETLALSDFPATEPDSSMYTGNATWTVESGTASVPTDSTPVSITDDVTYKATYASIPMKKVTWDWNDGSGTKHEDSIQSGVSTAPTTVDNTAQTNVGDSYRFVGWSDTQVGKDDARIGDLANYDIKQSASYDDIDSTNGVTYYAVWEPLVTLHAATDGKAGATVKDDSMSSGAATTGDVKVGAVTGKAYTDSTTAAGTTLSVKYTAQPESADTSGTAQFEAWTGGALTASFNTNPYTATVTTLAKDNAKDQYVDTTLTANFKAVYTVTFELHSDNSAEWVGTPTTTIKVADGGKLTAAQVPHSQPKTAAGFDANPTWATSVASMPLPTTGNDTTITGDVTYTVQYKAAANKTVTFNWNNGASPNASDKQAVTQNQGTFQPSETHAKPGYHQIGWTKDTPIDPDKATRTQFNAGGYDFTGVSYEDAADGGIYYAVWEKLIDVQAKTDGKTGGFVQSNSATTQAAQTPITKVGAVTGLDFGTSGSGNGNQLRIEYTATDNGSDATFSKWSTSASSPQTPYTDTALGTANIVVEPANLDRDSALDQYKSTTLTANFGAIYTLYFALDSSGSAEWTDGTAQSATKTVKKAEGATITADDIPKTKAAVGYEGDVRIEPDLPELATSSMKTNFTLSYQAKTSTVTYKLADADGQGNAISSSDYALSNTAWTYVPYNTAIDATRIPTLQKDSSGLKVDVDTTNDVRFTGNLTWSKSPVTAPDLAVGNQITDNVTYTATPELQKKDVYVVVEHGKFSDNTTSKKYTGVEYGALTANITGLVTDVDGITADTGYNVNGKSWSVKSGSLGGSTGGDDPTAAGTKLQPTANGDVVYTVKLEPQKYDVNFELNSDALYNDAQLSGTMTVSNVAHDGDIAKANNTFALPTLAVSSTGDAAKFAEKYAKADGATTPTIVWTVKGDTTNTPVDPLTYKVTGPTTFVGTPQLADVEITFKIQNGLWSVGGDSNEIKKNIKYGDSVKALLPNTSGAVADDGYRTNAGSWSAGADSESFDGSNGKEFTYSFPALKKVTIKIENGYWSDGSTEFTIDNSKHDTVQQDEIDDINNQMASINAMDGYFTTGSWVGGSDPRVGNKSIDGTTFTYTLPHAVTIRFEIENGSWGGSASGSDPIEYTIASGTTLQAAGYAAPTFGTPNSGYQASGSWHRDTASGATTNADAIGAATHTYDPSTQKDTWTYVYDFNKGQTTYTVNVYKQDLDSGNAVKSTYTRTDAPSGQLTTGTSVSRDNAIDLANGQGLLNDVDGFVLVEETSTPAAGITLDGDSSNNVINLYYDRKQFSVTYSWTIKKEDADAGADPGVTLPTDSTKYYYGAEYPVTQVSQDGWNFDGWWNGTSKLTSATQTMGTKDVTLSGTWERTAVTIGFSIGANMSGIGTLSSKATDNTTTDNKTNVASYTIKRKVGETFDFAVPSSSSNDEYKFHQWTTDNNINGTSIASGDGITVTADMDGKTYYAWWVKNLKVYYLRDAGTDPVGAFPETTTILGSGTGEFSGTNVPTYAESTDYDSGKTAEATHKPGYYFAGWTPSISGVTPGTTAVSSLTDSVYFTAKYEGLDHKLTIKLDHASDGEALADSYTNSVLKETVSGTETDKLYKTGETFRLPSATELTRPGYTLLGYKLAADDAKGDTIHYKNTDADLESVGGVVTVLSDKTDATAQVSEAIVITATPIWEVNKATVTFVYKVDAPRGDGSSPNFDDYTYTMEYNYGDKVKSKAYIPRDTTADNGSNHGRPEGYDDCTYEATSTNASMYLSGGSMGDVSTDSASDWTIGKDGVVGSVTITCTYHVKRYDVLFNLDSDAGTLIPDGVSITAPKYESTTMAAGVAYGTPIADVLNQVTLSGYNGNQYTGKVKTWAANPASMIAADLSTIKVGAVTPIAYASGDSRYGTDHLEGHYDYTVKELEKKKYTISLVTVGGKYDGVAYTSTNPHKLTVDAEYGATIAAALGLDDSDTANDKFDASKLRADDATTVLEWAPCEPTSKSDTITTNRVLTATYKSSHVVTFNVVGSTWDTLATAGQNAYDTTDKSITLSGDKKTLTFRVADGEAIGTRMPDVSKLAPATGYVSTDAAWDATPSQALVVSKDGLEFTYTFPKGKYGYEIKKYYLKYNSSTHTYGTPGTFNDYTQDGAKTVTVKSTDAAAEEFQSTITIASLNGNATSEKADYGDTPNATLSTPSLTIDAEADGALSNNHFNLFYDPKTIHLSFDWSGVAPAGEAEPADQSGFYNTLYTIQSSDIKPDADNKVFSGWTAPEGTKIIKAGASAETTAGPGGEKLAVGDSVVLLADTTLTGTWSAAQRTVTYKIDSEVDTTPYGASTTTTTTVADKIFTLTMGSQTLDSNYSTGITSTVTDKDYATAATAAPSNDDIDPAVTAMVDGKATTYKYDDMYEFSHWTYSVDGVDKGTVENPSKVVVTGSNGYVFTAHFKLKTFDITYTAGNYCNPLSGVEGETKFTGVKFGDDIPAPTGSSVKNGKGRHASVKSENTLQYNLNTNIYWTSKPSGFFFAPVDGEDATGLVTKAYGNLEFTPALAETKYKVYVYPDASYNPPTTNGYATNPPLTKPYEEIKDVTYAMSVFGSNAVQWATLSSLEAQFDGWSAVAWNGNPPTNYAAIQNALASAKGDWKGSFTLETAFGVTNAASGTDALLVFAKWKANPTNLIYHSNPIAASGQADATYTVTSGLSQGGTATLLSNTDIQNNSDRVSFKAPTGYSFDGWNDAIDASGTAIGTDYAAGATLPSLGATNTNVLYAKWREHTYTIEWLDKDDKVIATNADQKYTAANNVTAPTGVDPTAGDSNLVLTGWKVQSSGQGFATDVSGGTLDAASKPAADNGTVTMVPRFAGSVSLTYQAGDGGVFAETTGDGTSTSVTDTKGKTLDGNTAAEFDIDAKAADLMPTKPGYKFVGWSTDGTQAHVVSGNAYKITAPTRLTAVYTPLRVKYKVERWYEQTVGSNDWKLGTAADDWYERYGYADAQIDALTDGYATDDEKFTDKADAIPTVDDATAGTCKGYTFVEGASTRQVTPKYAATDADVVVVKLFYKIASYDITYKYTWADTADATSATPSVTKVTKQSGDTYTIEAVPATLPTGYHIDGVSEWQYEKKNGAAVSGDATGTITVTGDTVLYLPLAIDTFDVTFAVDANSPYVSKWKGETPAQLTEKVKYGKKPTLYDSVKNQVEAADTGAYTLAGWATGADSDGKLNYENPAEYTVTHDVTFTAAFAKTHTVSYFGGAHPQASFGELFKQSIFTEQPSPYNVSDVALVYKADDSVADLGDIPAADGYEFAGWTIENKSEAGAPLVNRTPKSSDWPFSGATANASYSLTAQWQPSEQTVTFKVGDHADASATNVVQTGKTEEKMAVPAGPTPAANYVFDRWVKVTDEGVSVDPGAPAALDPSTQATFDVPKIDTTYVAVYTVDISDIKISVSGSGTVSAVDVTKPRVPHEAGEVMETVEPKAGTGYRFDKWTKDNGHNEYVDFTGDENASIDPDKNLVIKADSNGVLNDANYRAVFVPAVYEVKFSNPDADDDKANPTGSYNIVYGNNKYWPVEHGKGIGSNANGNVLSDVKGAAGAVFDHWSYEYTDDEGNKKTGEATLDGVRTVAITSDTKFTAHWRYDPATLSFSKGETPTTPVTQGSVTGWPESKNMKVHDTVNLANAGGTFTRDGYDLVGWAETEGGPKVYELNDDYTFTKPEATLYPVWSKGQVTITYHANYKNFAPASDAVSVDSVNDSKAESAEFGEDAAAATATAEGFSFDPANVKTSYVDKNGTNGVPPETIELKYWSTSPTDAGGKTYAAGDTIPGSELEGSIDLYAIWQDKEFTISFDADGGVGTMNDVKATYSTDATIPPNAFTKVDYNFFRWTIEDPGKGAAFASDATGKGVSYTFKATHDLTFKANWVLQPGKKANIEVQLRDPADNSVFSGGRTTTNTINSTPLLTFNPVTDTDHFELVGWYTNRDFETKNALGTPQFAPNSNSTIRQIFEDDAIDQGDYASIWDNGTKAFTTLYQADSAVPVVVLYAKIVQKGYTVHYDMNPPADYVAEHTPDDQIIKEGEAQAIRTQSENFAGYSFLGWVKADSAPVGTFDTLADAAASVKYGDGDGVAVEDGYSTKDGELDTLKRGEVTLYAAWKALPNTVTFYDYYPNDGVSDDTVSKRQFGNQITDAVWTDKIAVAGVPNMVENSTPYTGATGYGSNPDYVFKGWYVAKDGKTLDIDYGVTTVGDIAKDYYTTAAGGSYTLEVYALWQPGRARLIYNTGGEGVDSHGLTATGQPFEDVRPNNVSTAATVTLTPPTAGARYTLEGQTHTGWKDENGSPVTSVTFERGSTDNQTVYPVFTPNNYNVEFVYDTGSIDTSAKTRAKDVRNDSLSTVGGQPWTSEGGLFNDVGYASDPSLPGYTFEGWYSTSTFVDDEGNSTLVRAAGAANTDDDVKGVTVKSLATAQGHTSYADQDGATVRLYAKWGSQSYTVNYDLNGGNYDAKASKASLDITDYQQVYADLVPALSKFDYEHYQVIGWHLVGTYDGRAYDYPVVAGSITTYEGLMAAFRAATASPNAPIQRELTLKAFYDQKVVPVTFTVSDTANAHLEGGDIEGTDTTSITFNVGEADGTLNGDGATQLPVIRAVGNNAAYAATGWYLGDASDDANMISGATDSYRLPINAGNSAGVADGVVSGDHYVTRTYVAKIEGGQVAGTVKYWYAGTDGAWNEGENGAFVSSVPASWTVEDVIDPDAYAAAGAREGFTYDDRDGDTLTVTAVPEDNVLNVYFTRNEHNLKYRYVYEGDGPDDPLANPADTPTRYGATVDVPAAPKATLSNYRWIGWYETDPTEDASATPLTTSFAMPDSDKTLFGYWKQAAYTVQFAGVYASESDAFNGGTPLSGTYNLVKRGIGDGAVAVWADNTLAEAHEGFDVYLRDLDTGMADDPDAEIQVDYHANVSAVMWAYKVGGAVTYITDPTSVKIAENTTFYAIASTAQAVTYMDGTLDGETIGTFGTVDGVTRITGLASGFHVADYLYDSVAAGDPAKAAGPLEADADSDNAGLPTGKVGYKFIGWSWQYQNGPTSASGTNRGAADPLHDLTPTSGSPIPATLNGNITFTALWQPTSSLLVYDLNDADGAVKGKWLNDAYSNPDGYRYTTGQVVSPLPTAADVERDGYTFVGWTWTDADGVEHQYADSFTMPGGTHNQKTVLSAQWTKNALTANFVTSSATMGTVLDPEGELPFAVEYDEALTDIGQVTVEAKPGYEFTGWTYRWVNLVTGRTETGSTADPVADAVKIRGNATFTAQFREQEGYTYGVVYRDAADAPADDRRADEVVDDLTANVGVAHDAWADSYERAFVKWTYTNNLGEVVDVTGDTLVSTLISAGVATDDDGNLVLTAVWQPKYEYKTVYVPFNATYDADAGEWAYEAKPALNEQGTNEWIEAYHDQLVKADSNIAGTMVKSWYIEHPEYGVTEGDIPGYEFKFDTAKELTLKMQETDADHEWLDWWSDDEVYTLEDGAITFYIPVIAREKYKVKFDLNDEATYAAGETLPAATDADLSEKDVRIFTTQDNIPEDADVDDELAPVRVGFNFGGWFNQRSDDDGNFKVEEEEIVAKQADSETMYGDLSVDAKGEWVEPPAEIEGDNTSAHYITLYAQWVEKKHIVNYAVGEDSEGVEIKLYDASDDAYGTDTVSEVIGAASADKFDEVGEGDAKTVVRSSDGTTKGAVARVNRGYDFVGWVAQRDNGEAVELDDVLGSESVSGSGSGSGSTDSGNGSGSGSGSVVSGGGLTTQSVVAVASARAMSALKLATMDGDELYTDKENVKPGVYTEGNLKGLFPGEDYNNGTDDPEAEAITYFALATQNASTQAILSPYGQFGEHGSDRAYTEPTQPAGTYFGERPVNGVWGVEDGKLPDNDAYSRSGWKLTGWRVTSNTTSETSSGTVDLTSADVITSADDRASGIVVPEAGLTIEGVWVQDDSGTSGGDNGGGNGGNGGGTDTTPTTTTQHTAKVNGKTLSDGTKIPSGSVKVNSGTKLSNSQIKNLLSNSSGKTASKWVVSYTDSNGGVHVNENLTAKKLISLLKSTPLYGDVTMTPADGAKGTSYSKAAGSSSTSSGSKSGSSGGSTRANTSSGSSGSSSSTGKAAPRTGDMLGYAAGGLVAVAAAAGFVIFIARRRSRDEE